MKARKLTKREFARAMKLGLGRAVLHVRDYGDEGLEEILKEAMLKSYVFDEMFESCRSWWVFSLLKHTGRLGDYAEYFLERIEQPDSQPTDIAQHIKLAGLFYEAGFEQFRSVVFRLSLRLIREKNYINVGVYELIDVGAIAGFQAAVREFGAAGIDEEDDDLTCNDILEYAENKLGNPEVGQCLDSLESRFPEVRKFRTAVAKWKDAPKRSAEKRIEPSLDEVLTSIERNEASNKQVSYQRFGKIATDDELKIVLDVLMKANNWEQQLDLLNVFVWRKPPVVSLKLISYLDSPNEKIRRACANALSHCSDRRVRAKAIYMLRNARENEWPNALACLSRNYRPTDAPLIYKTLKRMRNPNNVHWAGIIIDKIAEEYKAVELLECFLWLYEFGPESYCRRRFIEQLIDWNLCPADIVSEAQWDCGNEVRYVARNAMARRDLANTIF